MTNGWDCSGITDEGKGRSVMKGKVDAKTGDRIKIHIFFWK
jgi:hypothetical protein